MVVVVWTIAVVLALAGLLCFWRGVMGRKIAPHACPRCAYDLTGATGRVCPECGVEVATAGRPGRVRRWWLAPLGILLLAPVAMLALPAWTGTLIDLLVPERTLASEVSIGNVRVARYVEYNLPTRVQDALSKLRINLRPGSGEEVRVTHSGRVVFSRANRYVGLATTPAPGGAAMGVGDDLDGDGVPDLLVAAFSGGAHCCWTYFFVRLGDDPTLVAELQAENGAAFEKRILANGAVETITTTVDTAWNYWGTCYACAPKPEVKLRLSRGVLALAPDLMLGPLPSSADIAAQETKARQVVVALNGKLLEGGGGRAEPSDLWRTPLELLYSGHEPEAWALLDRAWPADVPGKDEFLKAFRENLAQSPYWPQIHAAFGGR